MMSILVLFAVDLTVFPTLTNRQTVPSWFIIIIFIVELYITYIGSSNLKRGGGENNVFGFSL